MQYWKSVDPLEYGKWLCIINDADKIMSRVDNSKQQVSVVINVDQLCSTNSHYDNSVILETNNNEECNEISEIESPDGQMPKISGVVPTAAKATPSDRSERQLGKKRKAADYILIGTFTLYLNGDKQGNKQKLYNEGLEWKNGAIRCTLCNTFVKQARTMMEHCYTKKHIRKIKLVGEDRGVPVHQTALETLNDSNKLGTLMPEVKNFILLLETQMYQLVKLLN